MFLLTTCRRASLILIFVFVLCAPFEVVGFFVPGSKSDGRHSSSTGVVFCRQTATTHLHLQKNETEDGKSGFFSGFSDVVEERGLLVADLFAIAIASQLMGLLDIVNDPEFLRNGGWFQPIPAVPSTLDVLVQRISTLSLIWIPVALARKDSFSSDSIAADNVAIKKSLRVVLDFSVVRVLVSLFVSLTTESNLDVSGTLRECYFVGLAIPSLRYLYGQYFR